MRDPDPEQRDDGGEDVTDDITDVRPMVGAGAGDGLEQGAYVIVQAGRSAGMMARISGPLVVIGRSQMADVRLLDDGVSREHARIEFASGRAWLRDLGSTNGTWLEGERVGSTPLPLHDGDRIRVGPDATLKYTLQDGEDQRFLADLYLQATRDPLTRAFNRKHFETQLDGEVSWHLRHGEALSLLMLDIDHFKDVNTCFGHPAGDQVLREVASALLQGVRAEDLVARIGGEEFAVLLRRTRQDDAMLLAERLRQVIETVAVPWGADRIGVRISIGCATAVGEELRASGRLVEEADQRLRVAKLSGRNRVCGAATASSPLLT
jgi:diguanylate cyclase (GGDEF)-like protein